MFGFLGLTGCFKPKDNIQTFTDVAAIVGFNYELFPPQPTLIILGIELLAPELYDIEGIYDGDAVVATFDVNYDDQPYLGYVLASNLRASKIDMAWATATEGGASTGGFNDVIGNMRLFDVIEYGYENSNVVLFAEFLHEVPRDLHFDYEMTYDINDESEIMPLYIRAKISGQSSLQPTQTVVKCAFDISYFIMHLRSSSKIGFHIMFNVGNEDGEEKFVGMDRPVLLQ